MRKSSWSTRRAATRFEQSSRRNKNLSLKNSCVNRTHRENATHPGKIAGFSKLQTNFDDELAGVGPGEEHVDGVGGFLEAFHDGLAVFDSCRTFSTGRARWRLPGSAKRSPGEGSRRREAASEERCPRSSCRDLPGMFVVDGGVKSRALL